MPTPGFQLNYTDKNTGVNFPTAWLVPSLQTINPGSKDPDNTVGNITMHLYVYQSEDLYLDRKDPSYTLQQQTVNNDPVFLTYFTPQLQSDIKNAQLGYWAAIANSL